MNYVKSVLKQFSIPSLLQLILNISLIVLAVILCVLLVKELIHFGKMMLSADSTLNEFLEAIIAFFLYFEFIAMIVKYFRENYHFPLRYFLYIGITAMVRLIIVDHHNPLNTLIYSGVILILIVSYYIINKTPVERPGK
ncbi:MULTISPECIES: phosphate-starvation-inducible protein PsiE [Brevibacillus]|uniref:Protein PsiE n=1 Tax=Brevibacillus parabrevis TaxID=54914 RepID=A0A4Y3PF88_BREPA|nr:MULTISPECIES: phosphate-starvation-inducible protein PsiE [Brevibacillus]MBU8715192.1 phosphate-starvation-inducible protein PsiE [Brevibacillus parabrevis]MED2255043.1 phosphate-starvation-inducible protein PsiE [Brevibacillus parabrevis]RNB93113.1 phosphate-starvation-inducible protein PsiE [Brevibacillus parabrevis]UED69842.1 phosphate-starvation-inducible protein PsiE [Brevibacillus sp. HD3.3A]WDV96142.1 phosphate-starvation-inducible protein PsiE [Brevibacillus parabrevis]